MRKIIFIFCFLLCGSVTFAQSDLLVNFTGQQIGNYIHLSFTVRGGISCAGTKVERSVDSIHFEPIGTIPGICGSGTSEESYSLDDSFPLKNQFNYYRINFGQAGNSVSIKLKYTDYGNGFLISPNPGERSLFIFHSNLNNQKLIFSVFNLEGNLVEQAETHGNTVLISGDYLSAGIYLLQVKNEAVILYTTKIIFQ